MRLQREVKRVRDALLREVRAHGSKRGKTTAHKLWLAAEKCLPQTVVDEMEKFRNGRQGRSWLLINTLLISLDARIDGSIGRKLSPDYVEDWSREQQSASNNLDGMRESDRLDLLTIHARALHEAALYLNPRFSSKRRLRPLPSVGMCALCWRLTVRPPNSSKYYCQVHRPSAKNKAYLGARAARHLRVSRGQTSEGCLYLYDRQRALGAEITTWWSSSEGRTQDPSDLHGCELLELMTHFPLVRSLLSEADFQSAGCVLNRLDIVIDHSNASLAAAAVAIMRDRYRFSDLLISAEAWLQTLAAFGASRTSVRCSLAQSMRQA